MPEMTVTERLNQTIASQRQKYPIDEAQLQWTVTRRPADDRIKSLREGYEVSVKCPITGYAGWSVRKTEQEARISALTRLIYARDYAL